MISAFNIQTINRGEKVVIADGIERAIELSGGHSEIVSVSPICDGSNDRFSAFFWWGIKPSACCRQVGIIHWLYILTGGGGSA